MVNRYKKLILIFSGVLTAYLIGTIYPSVATNLPPSFPQCPTISANIQAQYDYGWHAIVGDQNLHEGSDVVYDLENGNYVQCFCPLEGTDGVQTNWLNTTQINPAIRDELIGQGWHAVSTGNDWGLESDPFLAKNSSFVCGGGESEDNPTPTPTPEEGITPTITRAPINQPVGGSDDGSTSAVSTPQGCATTQPKAPTLISVAKITPTSIRLKWTSVDNATHYTIAYGTSDKNYAYGVANTGRVTAYEIGSLDPKENYFFVVRAVNNCKPGEFSPSLSITMTTGGGVGGVYENTNILGTSTLAPTGKTAFFLPFLPGILSSFTSEHKKTEQKEYSPLSVQFENRKEPVAIVPGTLSNNEWELATDKAMYLVGSGRIGEKGNIVVYGHNTLSVFAQVKNLKTTDLIRLTTAEQKTFTYRVVETKTVDPTAVEILLPTHDETLTLFTCDGLFDSKRRVIIAKRV